MNSILTCCAGIYVNVSLENEKCAALINCCRSEKHCCGNVSTTAAYSLAVNVENLVSCIYGVSGEGVVNTILVSGVNRSGGDTVREDIVACCGGLVNSRLRVHDVDDIVVFHAAGLEVVSYILAAVVTDSVLICIGANAFLSANVTNVICVCICTVGNKLVTYVAKVVVCICTLGENCATAVITYVVSVISSICMLAHYFLTACEVTVVVLVSIYVLGNNPYALVCGCDVTNVVVVGVVTKCNCALVTYEVRLCVNVLGSNCATAIVTEVIAVACNVCMLAHLCLTNITCVILVFVYTLGKSLTAVVTVVILVCVSALGENCLTNVTCVVLVFICAKVLAAVVTIVTLVFTVCALAAEAADTADIAVVGLVFVSTLGKLSAAITVVISDVALGAKVCVTSVAVVVSIDAVVAKSLFTYVTVVAVICVNTVVSHIELEVVEVADRKVVPVTCLKVSRCDIHGADLLRGEVLNVDKSELVAAAESPKSANLVVFDNYLEGVPSVACKRCPNGRLLVLGCSAEEEEGIGSSLTGVTVLEELGSLLDVSDYDLVTFCILNADVVTSTGVTVAVIKEVIEAENVCIAVAIILVECDLNDSAASAVVVGVVCRNKNCISCICRICSDVELVVLGLTKDALVCCCCDNDLIGDRTVCPSGIKNVVSNLIGVTYVKRKVAIGNTAKVVSDEYGDDVVVAVSCGSKCSTVFNYSNCSTGCIVYDPVVDYVLACIVSGNNRLDFLVRVESFYENTVNLAVCTLSVNVDDSNLCFTDVTDKVCIGVNAYRLATSITVVILVLTVYAKALAANVTCMAAVAAVNAKKSFAVVTCVVVVCVYAKASATNVTCTALILAISAKALVAYVTVVVAVLAISALAEELAANVTVVVDGSNVYTEVSSADVTLAVCICVNAKVSAANVTVVTLVLTVSAKVSATVVTVVTVGSGICVSVIANVAATVVTNVVLVVVKAITELISADIALVILVVVYVACGKLLVTCIAVVVVVAVSALACGCTAEVALMVAISVLTLGNSCAAKVALVILVLVCVDGKLLSANVTLVIAVRVSALRESCAAVVAVVVVVCICTGMLLLATVGSCSGDKATGRECKYNTHYEDEREKGAQFLKGGHLLRSSNYFIVDTHICAAYQ